MDENPFVISFDKRFSNIVFQSTDIQILNGTVVFENCFFDKISINCQDSSCHFINCHFSNNPSHTLLAENSALSIKNCIISSEENNEFLTSQILLFHSKANITETSINNCSLSHGIEAENSQLHLEKCNIEKIKGCGVMLTACTFEIINSSLTNNGSENEDFTQIYIKSSQGTILNTEITNSINAGGLYTTDKSNVKIITSIIESNSSGIKVEEFCSVEIINSLIKNNISEEDIPQIWVNNSEVMVEETKIESPNCCIYTQKGSVASINSCNITSKEESICIFETSTVQIKNSLISGKIYCENSKLYIDKSKVSTHDKTIIKAEEMDILHITHSTIQKDEISCKRCRHVVIQ